jgi:hypothetical protein
MQISLISKILGGLAFLSIFIFNLSTFIGYGDNGLSVANLRAYAASSSSAVVHRSCVPFPCSVVYTINNLEITYAGTLSKCVVTSEGSCFSSGCDKLCDAKPPLDK